LNTRIRTAFAERARDLLEEVHDTGLRDPETSEGLAELLAEPDPAASARYAREALAAKDLPGGVRALALHLLAKGEFEVGNFAAAVDPLKEVLQLRRSGEDWCMLGMCYLGLQQPQKALPALQRALAIRPDHQGIHQGLAAAYGLLGDRARAREHAEKAQWLLRHHPQ
jgi:tetratricopeptide (TPR) repeat protein